MTPETKELLKWGLPFVALEILLYLIFYVIAAFLFLVVGAIMTSYFTMKIIYMIRKKWIQFEQQQQR